MADGSSFAPILHERLPTPQEYRKFRDAAGWAPIEDPRAAAGLRGSLFSVVIEVEGAAVAMGRVVGDGAVYLYLQDVIVMPEHRGSGLGRQVTEALMAFVEAASGEGTFVGLMAARGAAGFYHRYGFVERNPNAPGMFLPP